MLPRIDRFARVMDIFLRFLTVRNIPKLFWSSPEPLTLRPPIVSCLFLIVGLMIFGFGEALIIAAGLGVTPWTVLAQGIAEKAGITVGTATFAISFAVLIFWIPLRQKPGIGTILNAVIIALMMDLALAILPRPEQFLIQLIMMLGGICAVGFGSAVYLIANLGPGARDGLMTAMQRITGYPILTVRGFLEVIVVVAGFVLGGTVGLGTVCFAFGIGIAVSASAYSLHMWFRSSR